MDPHLHGGGTGLDGTKQIDLTPHVRGANPRNRYLRFRGRLAMPPLQPAPT